MAAHDTPPVVPAQAGDRAAFAALFERYERRIYGFIHRMVGNADDAADLTQETFLKAYRALPRTGPDLNVNAWLHRIAANACLDALRRRRRARQLPWDHPAQAIPSREVEGDPESVLLGDETRHLVRSTLGRMSPRRRQALILRECMGLSCAEVGAALGISSTAAKSLLFHAREEFRRLYMSAYESPVPAGHSSHDTRGDPLPAQ